MSYLDSFLMVASVVFAYLLAGVVLIVIVGFVVEHGIKKYEEKTKEIEPKTPKAYRDVCVMCGGYVPEGTHVCGICKIKYGGDLDE